MRCFLDAHIFLWIIAGLRELSPTAVDMFVDLAHHHGLKVGITRYLTKHALISSTFTNRLSC
ncbi:MAG: hypothetical protein JSR29_20565 [Nitrospira sp.]|nr:hypothetical protein [Nitrospira sp.]